MVGWIPKTTDGGATWTNVTVPLDDNGNVLGDANGQAGYDLSLGIDPNNANIVFLGGVNTWKSTDGGSSWTNNNMWTSSSTYNSCNSPVVHADKHYLILF